MRLLLYTLLAGVAFSCSSQSTVSVVAPATPVEHPPVEARKSEQIPPKLFIGIVVDQMRADYLYRFWGDFGDGGFKRLMNDGFFCADHHFTYAPTYTGPGHASVYTGTTPAIHGIISNDWFDKESGAMVYCATDTTVNGVGTIKKGGKMSPHRLLTTTLTDELMLSSNFRSKVVGLSMKDRGAILPAGHHPTGAYWFMGGTEGVWATSTYYMQELPSWVKEFNNKNLPSNYLDGGWELLRSEDTYDESYADNNPYEAPYPGQLRPAFPHLFPAELENRFDYIKSSPLGNTLSVDFAIAAIEGEQMGQDQHPDFLALSFSCTDYVGHQFGPQSREVQDIYLRLDLELERFLKYLDSTVGEGNYTLFLTADHGGANIPGFLKQYNMPGGYWKPQSMLDDVDNYLKAKYGAGQWVLQYVNDQFFLNKALIAKKKLDIEDIAEEIVAIAMQQPEVHDAKVTSELLEVDHTEIPWRNVQRGIHPQRSGEVLVLIKPGYIENGYTGTTHGSPFSYDTHVPLIFFGKNIPAGETWRPTAIRDIAPTVSKLLRISQPSGCTGEMIFELNR
jgi:predicted AlkP superfamily pyrophosphatase or phosphodiesterase